MFLLRIFIFTLSLTSLLHATTPDISNLSNCIQEIRKAETNAPVVPTFDPYRSNYSLLLSDLEAASANLPHVYQEAAAKPLIKFLKDLGQKQYLKIFDNDPQDQQTALYYEIIPDVVLAVLFHEEAYVQKVNAFQEIVSDLYEGFLTDSKNLGNKSGTPVLPPTYGVIPPLVKFGNAASGPYTWPVDATNQVFGMHCAVVSLPPAQLAGGLLAWTTLGHETGGHDVTHADEGLLEELSKKVYEAIWKKFRSQKLADYWASCIDEASADVFGYLNMGPSTAIGLIGYFRALGNGKLRTVGSSDDPHPIDLLRGHLAASVVKRLGFKEAAIWSKVITNEVAKDNNTLYLVDKYGFYHRFPVPLANAIASADLVAETILHAKLTSLEGHSIHEIQDWKDADQDIVNILSQILKTSGKLPENLAGPELYAAHVVAAAAQTALERGANIPALFDEMHNFLATMHLNNPIWSVEPTQEALVLLERGTHAIRETVDDPKPHYTLLQLPEEEVVLGMR